MQNNEVPARKINTGNICPVCGYEGCHCGHLHQPRPAEGR